MSESRVDDDLATSKTFETDAEAAAFIKGFNLGCNNPGGITCRIDPDESFAVLIDFVDQTDHDAYLITIQAGKTCN